MSALQIVFIDCKQVHTSIHMPRKTNATQSCIFFAIEHKGLLCLLCLGIAGPFFLNSFAE